MVRWVLCQLVLVMVVAVVRVGSASLHVDQALPLPLPHSNTHFSRTGGVAVSCAGSLNMHGDTVALFGVNPSGSKNATLYAVNMPTNGQQTSHVVKSLSLPLSTGKLFFCFGANGYDAHGAVGPDPLAPYIFVATADSSLIVVDTHAWAVKSVVSLTAQIPVGYMGDVAVWGSVEGGTAYTTQVYLTGKSSIVKYDLNVEGSGDVTFTYLRTAQLPSLYDIWSVAIDSSGHCVYASGTHAETGVVFQLCNSLDTPTPTDHAATADSSMSDTFGDTVSGPFVNVTLDSKQPFAVHVSPDDVADKHGADGDSISYRVFLLSAFRIVSLHATYDVDNGVAQTPVLTLSYQSKRLSEDDFLYELACWKPYADSETVSAAVALDAPAAARTYSSSVSLSLVAVLSGGTRWEVWDVCPDGVTGACRLPPLKIASAHDHLAVYTPAPGTSFQLGFAQPGPHSCLWHPSREHVWLGASYQFDAHGNATDGVLESRFVSNTSGSSDSKTVMIVLLVVGSVALIVVLFYFIRQRYCTRPAWGEESYWRVEDESAPGSHVIQDWPESEQQPRYDNVYQ